VEDNWCTYGTVLTPARSGESEDLDSKSRRIEVARGSEIFVLEPEDPVG
jgi:hypothetical protein